MCARGFESGLRPAAGAGTWYPSGEKNLRREVEEYINAAPQAEGKGRLIALVSPHAGYRYSGAVAGHAYRQVEGLSFDTVVCVGLSHGIPLHRASVLDGDAYETPLARTPIDKDLVARLLKHDEVFYYHAEAHAVHRGFYGPQAEHSVENQLPFLQMVLPEFRFVEVLLQQATVDFCRQVGKAIAEEVRNGNALLVASTDLTHFPRQEDAERVDRAALSAIVEPDLDRAAAELDRIEVESQGTPGLSCVMCAKGAVLAVIAAAQALGADTGVILKYTNSGMVTGDSSRVVGYGAVAYYQSRRE
jgi:AmmeMemoRadiSam system protein B